MNGRSHITISIESAICGGSLSLLKNGVEAASWAGTSTISKAEELLANIDELLTTAGISKRDIDLVAVSAGPGSFTGIRIGIATALGLKTGLGIRMASRSALFAIADSAQSSRPLQVALPVGREAVCIQRFERIGDEINSVNEPATVTQTEFVLLVASESDTVFVVHEGLYRLVPESNQVVNFGWNIAKAVGSACYQAPDLNTNPIFISKSF